MALMKRICQGQNLPINPPMKAPMEPFPYKTLPANQTTPPATFRTDQQEAAERRLQEMEGLDLNERNQKAFERMMWAKDRIRVHGPQVCHKGETCSVAPKPKCKKKPPYSPICPKESLLDNRSYKKYRDALKNDTGRKNKGAKEASSKQDDKLELETETPMSKDAVKDEQESSHCYSPSNTERKDQRPTV